MELRGKEAVVIGAGASGFGAASLLVRQGAKVRLNDARDAGALGAVGERFVGLGVDLAVGDHGRARFSGADLVVVSPGVPPLPVLDELEADGVEVIGEAELATRFFEGDLVGVTGTNGKSTVTTLIGRMLEASGRPTFLGGNLGTALSDAVDHPGAKPGGVVVAELSSFQLERVSRLRPQVGVLLNVSADHLDRYPSYEAYAAAKGHLFRAQRPEDHAVVPAGDETVRALAATGPATQHEFGLDSGAVRVDGGALADEVTGFRFPLAELPLAGRHNQLNAAAAILAARLAGATLDGLDAGLRAAASLPHRAEKVRTLGGVDFIDDSKATNVGAAVASLEGLASPSRRAVLIAGGVDKGGSYEPLARRMAEVGRAAVLIGQAAPLIRAAFSGLDLPVEDAPSLDDALARAAAFAQPGDVVLLAPACSSYDQFRSYAERGDVFQAAVHALPEVTS